MRSWWLSLLVVVATVLAGGLPLLGLREMASDDEAQRAHPPIEMMATGDWLVPRLNGEPYIKKPPLIYWQTVPYYAVLGVSEWSARIGSVVGGVAVGAAMLAWGRRLLGERGGLLAAMFLVTNVLVVGKTRQCQLDIHLLLWTLLAQWAWLSALRRLESGTGGFTRLVLLGGGALAIANMYKFPVPWLFALAPVVGTVVVRRQWGWLARPQWLTALAISAAPFAAWSWAAAEAIGWDTVRRIYEKEVELRLHPTAIQTEPAYYYLLVLLGGFGPWGVFALWFRRRALRHRVRDLGLPMVYATSGGVISLLFLTATPAKEAEYLIPALPLFSLMLGAAADSMIALSADSWRTERRTWVAIGVAATAFVGAFLVYETLRARNEIAKKSTRPVAEHIRALADAGMPVYYYDLDKPSLYFYVRRQAINTDDPDELAWLLSHTEQAVVVAQKKRHERLSTAIPNLVDHYTLPLPLQASYEFHVYRREEVAVVEETASTSVLR